jgi:hypothetical protein
MDYLLHGQQLFDQLIWSLKKRRATRIHFNEALTGSRCIHHFLQFQQKSLILQCGDLNLAQLLKHSSIMYIDLLEISIGSACTTKRAKQTSSSEQSW